MEIHVAENGQSFGIPDCQPTSTIERLQNVLAPVTGTPVYDQMLICGDQRLEPHRNLMSYKLPDETRHVFLFNRARLMADSPLPPPEEFEVIEAALPPPPSSVSTGSHPLDGASDPALKAIPSYEIQFKYHYEKGLAVLNASQMKLDACRRLLREQQVQELALETGRGNMDFHYKIIDNAYSDFIKQYNRLYKQHSELLANFERDLERLRSCRLHPGLRSPHRETLLDCVKEVKLRKWAEHCTMSFKQFNGKVADLKERYAELQRNVQALFYTPPAVDIPQLIETIEEHARYTEDQNNIIQSFSKDVNTVKRLVEECVSGQFSGSIRPHDAVSALGPMYDVHEKSHLPRMEACSRELGKLLQYCQKSKNTMSRCVHTRLRNVAALQSNLKDMRNQLAIFKEAMNRQEEIFQELKVVRRTGSAYKACLAEASRRRAFMKLYMGQAGQLVENVAREREAEVSRRAEFLRAQTVYFSRDMLEAMGLYENPSQCVVNIAQFDTNLLNVDIADLERYAPESLVGPILKISDTGSGRGRGGGVHSVSDSDLQGLRLAREDFEDESEDPGVGEKISGTSNLEVENAWLKGELASAVARLCQVDPEVEAEEAGDTDLPRRDFPGAHQRSLALQKTVDALRLKDDYAKRVHELLSDKESQCQTYEKRIRELEQRLSDQHLQMQKLAENVNEQCAHHTQDHSVDESETSDVTAVRTLNVAEPMDEGVSSLPMNEEQEEDPQPEQSASNEAGAESLSVESGHGKDGIDKTMSDVSRDMVRDMSPLEGSNTGEVLNEGNGSAVGEAIIVEGSSEAAEGGNVNEGDPEVASGERIPPLALQVDVAEVFSRETGEQVVTLQRALLEKTDECVAMEEKLRAALAEGCQIHAKVDSNAELLSECQINCAHLENRLHEAREQARVNLVIADRRTSEYYALRASSVRLRGLMERLRSCISASENPGFEESLRKLVLSLSNPSPGESDDDAQFRTVIRILADKFGALAQQRAELLERCTIAENNQQLWTSRLMRSRESF